MGLLTQAKRRDRMPSRTAENYARQWDQWWFHSEPRMAEKNARTVFEHWAKLVRLSPADAEIVWRKWNVGGVREEWR